MLVSVEVDSVDNNDQHLQHGIFEKISSSLISTRRIIAVTGAGISVSAGIPDFRSANGLYERVLSAPTSPTQAPLPSAKGKDFFDAGFFHNPATRPLFNRFVAELRTMCTTGTPTPTHNFLHALATEGRLIRWYTQNIDGLEKATGLVTSTFVGNMCERKAAVVSLHGTLDRLVCTLCKNLSEFTNEHEKAFSRGESPECTRCAAFSADRRANGRRPVKGGIMRPDIVLYNEPHPQGDVISNYLMQDLSKRPNILLVMGTSLKVVGLKKLVKDLARSVRQQQDGLVLFINKTPAPPSEWKTIFDYEFIGECDKWVNLIQKMINEPSILSDQSKGLGITLDDEASLSTKSLSLPTTKISTRDGRIDRLFKVVRNSNPARIIETKKHRQQDHNPKRDGADDDSPPPEDNHPANFTSKTPTTILPAQSGSTRVLRSSASKPAVP